MKPGLWLINEHEERIGLWTETVRKENRLKAFLDAETDIERDTGTDRTEIIGIMMEMCVGNPADSDDLQNLINRMEHRLPVDEEMIHEAAEMKYSQDIVDGEVTDT